MVIVGVYLGVTSGLDSGVRNQKLDTLTSLGRQYTGPIWQAIDRSMPAKRLDARVRQAADASGARVTLFAVSRGTQGPQIDLRSDSTQQTEISDLQFDVALEAARTRKVARGTEAGNTGRVAEAALPLRLTPPGAKHSDVYYVAVYSAPLEDVESTVSLIRQRVLVAGAIALLAALLAGYLVARAFSRRVVRIGRHVLPMELLQVVVHKYPCR